MDMDERNIKEQEALKMWKAQCDPSESLQVDYEWINNSCFVTAYTWDNRRVTVQVGWDDFGAYVWNGSCYRFAKSCNRKFGTLILEQF